MKTRNALVAAFAVVAALALGSLGCQNKAKPKTVPETPRAQVEAPAQPRQAEITPPLAEPFPQSNVDKTTVAEPTMDEFNRQGVLRTVYFGYNSNDIDEAAKATLQANAAWLAAHPKYTVEIGGHCDERGSIGYNVALGDRRASEVRNYLAGLGIEPRQLVAISYGEEKPADSGHDEAAWTRNRRAEFTILP